MALVSFSFIPFRYVGIQDVENIKNDDG